MSTSSNFSEEKVAPKDEFSKHYWFPKRNEAITTPFVQRHLWRGTYLVNRVWKGKDIMFNSQSLRKSFESRRISLSIEGYYRKPESYSGCSKMRSIVFRQQDFILGNAIGRSNIYVLKDKVFSLSLRPGPVWRSSF